MSEHDRYGNLSESWFVNAKTDLYVIENGTLTAMMYCNEILDQLVRLYADAIGPEFIRMYNYAFPHRAHAITTIWNTSQSSVWTGLLDHRT